MPLYEYGCLECGAQFEKLVRPNDSDPIVCPRCQSTQVDRLLSLFATTQHAPSQGGSESTTATAPGAAMHKPHCGYDWAKP